MGSTVDFLDPETWNVPAQLAENWQKIALAIVAVGGAIGSVAKWGITPIREAWSRLSRAPQTDEKDAEIERLKTALAIRAAETVEHHGYRYRKGTDGKPKGRPYCPVCENDGLFILLTQTWEKGRPWQCPKCEAKFNSAPSFHY